MLTEESSVVFGLLCELHQICEELSLPYFLSPRLALSACQGAGMPKNPGAGRILMKAEDMEALRLHLSSRLPERRALESMMDGGYFPGFFLRYENLDTLYLRPNQGINFRNPCMYVDIYPIRPGIYKTLGKRLNLLEEGWRTTTYELYGYPFRKVQLETLPMRIWARFGRDAMARKIYQRLLSVSQWKERKNCFYIVQDRITQMPADLFEETGTITLEGAPFLVPADLERYLSSVYGEEYMENTETYTPSRNVFISTRISAEEYFSRFAGRRELEKYGKLRKKVFLRKRRISRYRKHLDKGWRYVKSLAAERQVETMYLERKDLLLTYHREGDFRRLENAFIPYHRLVKKTLSEGRLPALDPELMPVYLDNLVHSGNFRNLARVQRILAKTAMEQDEETPDDEV